MVRLFENIQEIIKYFKKNKKCILISFALSPLIRKLYIFYIFLNIIAIFKIPYIYINGIAHANSLIDSIIIKWCIIFQLNINKYEKIDLYTYILLNYTLIIYTLFSIRSLKFSIEIYKMLKIYKTIKKIPIYELYKKEFLFAHKTIDQIKIFKKNIKIL